MNKKGFTLVELLGVIVILGIIMVVVFPMAIDYFQESKGKGEEIFLSNLERGISSYVAEVSSSLNYTEDCSSKSVNDIFLDETSQVSVCKAPDKKLSDVVDANYLVANEIVNPKNEVKCNIDKAVLEIYRDENYVTCFTLSNLGCGFGEGVVINTCSTEEEDE